MDNNQERLREIIAFLIYCIPYSVIYSISLSNLIIVLAFLISLVKIGLNKNINIDWISFCVPISVFLIPAISLIYTDNLGKGISILETRFPLLLFPFIIAFWKPDFSHHNLLIKNYILSLIFTFLLVISIAIYRNILGPGPEVWFNKWYYHYSDLTEPISIDPLYLALFVGFGILILLNDQFKVHNHIPIFRRKLSILIVCLLCVFLSLIGARSIILITLFLTVYLFIRNINFFSERNAKLKAITITILIVGASILSPVTRERFEGLFLNRFEFSNYSVDRFVIWSVAISHIKDNPSKYFFGNGIGSSEVVMSNMYDQEKINWDFEKKTNTHNQYLEFLLDTGVVGLLFLIWFLCFTLITFHKKSDQAAILFILFFTLSMIVENYLNRQKGVVFIGLFYSLFYFKENKYIQNLKEK